MTCTADIHGVCAGPQLTDEALLSTEVGVMKIPEPERDCLVGWIIATSAYQ